MSGRSAHPDGGSGDSTPAPRPDPLPFEIHVRPDRDRVLVCPSGDLDLATADIVEAEVVALLERGFDRVVIDLRDVSFIDSTGIRTLIVTQKQAAAAGQMVSVILGGPAACRPLELSGMVAVLNVESAEPYPI